MSGTFKNWKIEDSLFYPLGLFNNSNRSGTVFVTWSCNSLITYIFKKIENSTALKDTYEIQLQGTIQDIISTQCNTLCLTTAGHIYYFSSYRNLKRLDHLEGVRCLTSTANGFAVIKVTKSNQINLEIYNDFTISSKSDEGKKIIDISFDENNLLDSSWSDEKFCICSVQVNAENRIFLEILAKQSINGTEVYFFTINNSLFGLLLSDGSTGDNGIFFIHTVVSEIDSIRVSNEINAILLLMTCGAMEVIFYSKLSKALDRITHIIETEILSSTFAEDCFYYADSNQVLRCQLSYDEHQHTIVVQKTAMPVYGVVALTWVQTIRKLVCLTENNIFYRMKFPQSEPDHCLSEFVELSDEKFKQVERHFLNLVNMTDESDRIQKQIKLECHKQEVLAVYKQKDLYMDLLSAQINFHKNIPLLKRVTLYPIKEQAVTKGSYFATIEVRIKSNRILNFGFWRVSLHLSAENSITKSVLINSEIIKHPFTILLHIQKPSILILPEIRVELTSHLKIGSDFIYISIPAQITTVNIDELFAQTLTIMLDPNKQTFNQKIMALIGNESPTSKDPLQSFSTKFKTPILLTLEELHKIFGAIVSTKNLSHEFSVYLLGEKIDIEFQELENILVVICKDPGALYYIKIYLAKKLWTELRDDSNLSIDHKLQSLLKIEAQLISQRTGNSTLKFYGSSLMKIYFALRKDCVAHIL